MIGIRLAELKDFDFFYDLKCEDSNVFWTGHGEKPKRENLLSFFIKAIENADRSDARKIYIVEDDGMRVGHLYITPENSGGGYFELATAISERYWGRGYARKAIALGLEKGKKLGFHKMRDCIREDNIASMKAYKACGVTVMDEYRMVYIPKLGKKVRMYYIEKDL